MKLELLTEKELLEISAGGAGKCVAGIASGAVGGFLTGASYTWEFGPAVIYGSGVGALAGGVAGGIAGC
ncbi:Blp family class II bacteriocin [Bacillus pacificus]|jgi:hypothetical protein|uniref:Bacteriocin n=2 Tax=Bacillus cereus TaxID=1396 RepID=Q73F41_BACC1|nr:MULTISPECIES: Blp family class II bacteriocin [Bacillus]AAS39102.1 hypothetical protein BCE_0166 [Bacillus cereus ATCC 10987]EMA6344118.1 Blp family class II bacteriocin [Bacillus cytotoxicus]KXY36146.1 hypothetical protein AT268_34260 [Bacillus cereus]MCU5363859.1 Blp family class II bacteriocin [Bacillus pacificus]MCU5401276.1 Blp family class II bacteriocin [Bacillus pacificus]